MREREKERQRQRDRERSGDKLFLKNMHIERTDEKCELSSCFLCSRSLLVRRSKVIQSTATPSGNNAVKIQYRGLRGA